MYFTKSIGDDSIAIIKDSKTITVFTKTNVSAILEKVENIPDRWQEDTDVKKFIAA